MARSKKARDKHAEDQAKRGIALLGLLVAALAGRAFGLAAIDVAEGALVGFRRGGGLIPLLATAVFAGSDRRGWRGRRRFRRRGAILVRRRFAAGKREDREHYQGEERRGPGRPVDDRGYHGGDTS